MIQQLMKYKEIEYEEQANKIFGVVTAVVTNNKDPEKKGRLKVKYAWMGEAKAIESDWVRMVTMMAGNGRGMHFLPEVDDEVLVAFEHGNINYPYIVGALWNGKDKVIEQNSDGKNNIKMIKSRSGHTITLDDSDGKEKITIEDKSKKRNITFDTKKKELSITNDDSSGNIIIKAKGDVQVSAEKKVTLTGKSGVTIKSDGDVSIEGKNLKFKSKMATKVEAGSSLNAKSTAAMDLKAGSALNVKASATAKVEGLKLDLKSSASTAVSSSGITEVKGSMVKVN
jgi:uncharacterized protein involved in type VI secretion and phage assembly